MFSPSLGPQTMQQQVQVLDDDRAGEPVCALLIKQIAKIPQQQHLKVFIETPAHSDGDLAAERTCVRAARISDRDQRAPIIALPAGQLFGHRRFYGELAVPRPSGEVCAGQRKHLNLFFVLAVKLFPVDRCFGVTIKPDDNRATR